MAHCSVFPTAAGWVGIQSSSGVVQRVILPRRSAHEVRELLSGAQEKPDMCPGLQQRLQDYFSGKYADFPDELDFSGASEFQQLVWQAARLIPYGKTKSYQWVASQIARPGAARAVGQALGKNPLPIIVPCHRVLASDGGLGGFAEGVRIKRHLLDLENGGP